MTTKSATNSDWLTIGSAFFLAGVLSTLIVALAIARFDTIFGHVRAWASTSKSHKNKATSEAETKMVACGGNVMKDHEDESDTGKEDAEESKEVVVSKPFEFRERLWHEPPELDYSWYDKFYEVQKEFKNIGKDVEFRTSYLDLHIESHLLHDYQNWTNKHGFDEGGPNEEWVFYRRLGTSVRADFREVCEELSFGIFPRYNKSGADAKEIHDIIAEVDNRKYVQGLPD